jgi:hypothetical protein
MGKDLIPFVPEPQGKAEATICVEIPQYVQQIVKRAGTVNIIV